MPDFPPFVRSPQNRIARSSQYTDDIEGYVFDGVDGSQVALWTCTANRVSKEHAHAFDEYVLVIEGKCTVILDLRSARRAADSPKGRERSRVELLAGQELHIPKGTRQSMEVVAGTRTLHVFGGKRAKRESDS